MTEGDFPFSELLAQRRMRDPAPLPLALTILFLAFSFLVPAQKTFCAESWQLSLARAERFYEFARPDSAIIMATQAKDEIDRDSASPDSARAFILQRLAAYHKQIWSKALADSLFFQALSIRMSILATQESPNSADTFAVAQALDGIASVYAAQGEFKLAAQYYERALVIRERMLGPKDLAVARNLCDLACMHSIEESPYLRLRRFFDHDSTASMLYERALAILQVMPEPPASLLIEVLLGMAHAVSYKEGPPWYERALKATQELCGSDSMAIAYRLCDLGMSLAYCGGTHNDSLAVLYIERGQSILERASYSGHLQSLDALGFLTGRIGRNHDMSAKAIECAERNLKIVKRFYGSRNLEVAEHLSELGIVYDDLDAELTCDKEIVSIEEEICGVKNPYIIRALSNLADTHVERKEYDSAEALLLRCLSIREDAYGRDDLRILPDLYELAFFYRARLKFPKAERLYSRALALCRLRPSLSHDKLTEALTKLANFYGIINQGQKAMDMYEEVLAIEVSNSKPDSLNIVYALENLALAHGELSRNFEAAESLYARSLAIKQAAYPDDDRRIAICKRKLAGVYIAQGRETDAEEILRNLLEFYSSKTFDYPCANEKVDLARVYEALASLRNSQGLFADFEQLAARSIELLEECGNNDLLIYPLNLLGISNFYQGKYAAALRIWKRARDLIVQQESPAPSMLAAIIGNLANYYKTQGYYAEAGKQYERATAVIEQAYGHGSPHLVTNLINYSDICYRLNGEKSAREHLLRARDIAMRSLDPNISFYGEANYIEWLRREKDFEKAEEVTAVLLESIQSKYPDNHPKVRITKQMQANNYFGQKKYALARDAYVNILNSVGCSAFPDTLAMVEILAALSFLELTGFHNPTAADSFCSIGLAMARTKFVQDEQHYFRLLRALSYIAYYQGDLTKCLETSYRCFELARNELIQNAYLLSEQEALSLSSMMHFALNEYLTFSSHCRDKDNNREDRAADVILSAKGQVTAEILLRQRRLLFKTDSKTRNLLNAIRAAKEQVSDNFIAGLSADQSLLSHPRKRLIEAKIEEMEKEAYERLGAASPSPQMNAVTQMDIRSALPPRSALFEYVRYNSRAIDSFSDEDVPYYAVAVIDAERTTKVVSLGKAADIDTIIAHYRLHMSRLAASRRMPGDEDKSKYARLAQQLYRAIWQPIDDYAKGKDLVLIAPDGALNLISFAGLVSPDEKYLIEQYTIHYVTTGRDLAGREHNIRKNRALLAIGDPDFDLASMEDFPQDISFRGGLSDSCGTPLANNRSGCDALFAQKLKRAPGTKKEVETIANLWRKQCQESSLVYLGNAATEGSFRTHAPGKRIIHIATHGFFLDDACSRNEMVPKEPMMRENLAENPLLLSGLFLAGANVSGRLADSLGTYDGVLTALEIADMNLMGTQIVVLSACETGLGASVQGEGLFGLRRAFLLAGAETVVSSLWPVSDRRTTELMSLFYGSSSLTIADSMRQMQLEYIRKYRKANLPDHPYNWAPFIAIGAWNTQFMKNSIH